MNPLKRTISVFELVLIILIVASLVGNIYFIFRYSTVKDELERKQESAEIQNINSKILSFTKMFIKDVLTIGEKVDGTAVPYQYVKGASARKKNVRLWLKRFKKIHYRNLSHDKK